MSFATSRGWERGCWGGVLVGALLVAGCGKDFTQLDVDRPEPSPSEPPPVEQGALDARIPDAGDAGGGAAGAPDAEVPAPAVVPFVLPEGITQLPAKLELAGDWRLAEAFPGISFDDPVALIAAPGTNQLIVSQREGKVYAFENRPDVTEKRLILDLSGQNQGENDSGLLGIAFHPQFGQVGSANARYLYAHYAFREAPIVGRTPPISTRTRSRLSRFSVDLQTLVADPGSEFVLIDQQDQSIWHQGGALMFHPRDGFLYLTVGDEGGSRCQYGNCQRIDKDLFSGVLRIDVDQRGGNVSHPIVRQPETGTTQGYFIPNDNPFVGQAGVLEEFYALGLRNTYRMTYDPVDDIVWMGEVGQEGRDEMDVLAPAANYQWNVFEGTKVGFGTMPEAPLGVWTDPVLDFDRRLILSIIGGYVYRGQRLPALQGKYIFADWSRGNIFALPYQRSGGQLQLGEPLHLMTAEFRNREETLCQGAGRATARAPDSARDAAVGGGSGAGVLRPHVQVERGGHGCRARDRPADGDVGGDRCGRQSAAARLLLSRSARLHGLPQRAGGARARRAHGAAQRSARGQRRNGAEPAAELGGARPISHNSRARRARPVSAAGASER